MEVGEGEVLACPFCGSGHAPELQDTGDDDACYLECLECGASTAVCETPEAARQAWNRRPA